MQKCFILILTFLIVVPAEAQEKITAETILSNVLTKYIQPRYADLHSRSIVLQESVSRLCTTPSNRNLIDAQSAFSDFAHTWAGLEWFRVGPVMSKNRVERMLFYPDRKSTGLKQVQRALAKQDETVASPDSISKKSVAVQGLGALEFILFGTGYEELTSETGAFRCTFAQSITENLSVISRTLSDGWSEGTIASNYWLKPSDDNPLFRNENEALAVLIGTAVHGLEAIRDIRIGAFLKEEAELDRPKSALMWRSQNTVQMISHGLEGLQDLFNVSSIEKILPEDSSNIGDAVRFEFNLSINAASSLDRAISEILKSEEDRQKIAYLKLAVGFTISKIDQDLSQALGLSAGFSFGDGD